MEYSLFDIASSIRNSLLRRIGEFISYTSWDNDTICRIVKSTVSDIKKCTWYKDIDPNEFTEEELKNLGFQKWSEDDPIYLLPIWIFNFLPEEVYLKSIDGEEKIFKRSELDNDNRFGFLAYGVMPKKGVI